MLQQPEIATKLCAAIAENYKESSIEVVIAPALGGVFVAHETARALGVRAIFAERVNGELQNTVIETLPAVSQFWKYNPAEYLREPLYAR